MSSRVALITGASGGLGSIVVPMFLESGYRVAAVAHEWPEPAPAHKSCVAMTADLQVSAVCENVIRKTLDVYGRIDCLVHLVGRFAPGRPIEETSDEVWDDLLNGNLRTAFNMIRAVIRPMRSAGGGCMVLVGSTAAIQPVVTWSAFSAAMGGLEALVQVAAAELRRDKITVTVLHPSTIDTPFVRAHCAAEESSNWVNPRHMGSLMLWLCSSAGADVSGASIAMPARQAHPAYHWPGIAG